jgi:hypothetical protein
MLLVAIKGAGVGNISNNQPNCDGFWEIERGTIKMVGKVRLATNDLWLPTSDAPYRITDFEDWNWTPYNLEHLDDK